MTDPTTEATTGLEIAVIGMAIRVPGARDLETFWENLRDGVESITRLERDELLANGVDAALVDDPRYVPAAAVLDDVDRFDAGFFGYTPREAEVMDPQHRIFLECAWEALEAAGHDPARYRGRIGVYAGAGISTYLLRNLGMRTDGTTSRIHRILGNDKDHLATRVSYKLNLRGPAVTVQTACSTSLVAMHLAGQSLLVGECDMALAGGVTITVPHRVGYLYEEQGIYSPDGRCRAFDADASGTVGGSGVAIVVLKRLETALADGDHIQAVILGSAINNDGAAKVGYTAPSIDGQAQVVRMALATAGIEPETVGYVETHGTGTPLGDPIEVTALARAFRAAGDRKQFCAIGSLKTNVGHLDCAAGAAGLVKTVLALQHGEIPPSLNYRRPSPEIDFAGGPFFVNDARRKWQADGAPRRAGVSSFGMGGTNAHVLVQEAPVPVASAPGRPFELLLLSGRTREALETLSGRLAEHLERHPDTPLADVAHTLQVGRRAFAHRLAAVCADAGEAVAALASGDPRHVATEIHEAGERPILFLFPGQGSQYVDMGRGLRETEPDFRRTLDECLDLLEPGLGREVRAALFPEPERAAAAAERLERTELAQPALFAVEYALARLWMSWGVAPTATIGHSVGEYVAACLAGVFSLEDGLALVAERGRLMQALPAGGMLAVGLSADETRELLPSDLSVAAINERARCVVAGPGEAIRDFEAEAARRSVTTRRLHTSHAFHSAMMDPILEPFRERVARVELSAPRIPFVSNLTGTWIEPAQAVDPEYWVRHAREAVRFEKGLGELLQERRAILLECGPGRTLSTFAGRHPDRGQEHVIVSSLKHPGSEQADCAFLLRALGRLWLSGVEIDWPEFRGDERRRRMPLPTYPFERTRFWIEADDAGEAPADRGKISDVSRWFYVEGWRRLPRGTAEAVPPSGERPWLVLAEASGIGDAVVRRLRDRRRLTVVRPGDAWAAIDGHTFAVPPGAPEGFDALVEALAERDRLPDTLVHLWGTAGPDASVDAEMDRGFHSLLPLLQALERTAPDGDLRVVLVTRGALEVTGDEELVPARAATLGLGRVASQELPRVSCRGVDLAGEGDGVIDLLVAELEARDGGPLVAIRGRHRWIPTYDRVALAPPSGTPSRLRENGVYLVTGGTGGVGLEVASLLARTARARLVLVSRRELPPRGEWERIVAAGARSETERRLERLLEIESRGAEVFAVAADVTDRRSMESAWERGRERFGEIQGVFHAAGAAQDAQPLRLASRAECARHFAPKLQGLAVLEEVLRDRELDFCLVFSSLSSVLGAVGYGAYAAAHATMDAFCARRARHSSFPWIAVNWDNWLTWRTEGQGVEDENEYLMTAAEGADALSRVLSHPDDQRLVVSTGDLNRRLQEWVRPGGKPKADRGSRYARPSLATDYAEPSSDAERLLAAIWGRELGIDAVGIHDDYFELGGDSVIAIQVVSEAAERGLRLTPQDLFAHPTIAELAAMAGAAGPLAEHGPVTGDVPLTPIQHWFFERRLPSPHHFNLPALLEARDGLDLDTLRKVLRILLAHHDALRLRFRRAGDTFEAFVAAPDEPVCAELVDLSGKAGGELEAALREHGARAQASLDLEAGPLVRAVMFETDEGIANQVLLAVHHLLVDVVSWRILREDFERVQDNLLGGREPGLRPRTTSYQRWAGALREYAEDAATAERAYWLRVARSDPHALPVDFPVTEGSNREGSARTVRLALAEDETSSLLSALPGRGGARLQDALLAALARAVGDWTGGGPLLVDLEMHGREPIVEGLDLSRTVGWFTSLFPVVLELGEAPDPGTALEEVRRCLRDVPRGGVGYGALRYLSGDQDLAAELRAMRRPEISFLYLGQARSGAASAAWQPRDLGPAVDPRQPRSHVLQVVAQAREGRLHTEWIFSRDLHRAETIEALAQGFLDRLREIPEQGRVEPAAPLPRDFPAARLGRGDLDKLLNKISRPVHGARSR